MKRTISVHVEVADEIDYAEAIKRIANSPEIIDYMFTGNTKSLRALLSTPPDALATGSPPAGGPKSLAAFPKTKWPA